MTETADLIQTIYEDAIVCVLAGINNDKDESRVKTRRQAAEQIRKRAESIKLKDIV